MLYVFSKFSVQFEEIFADIYVFLVTRAHLAVFCNQSTLGCNLHQGSDGHRW